MAICIFRILTCVGHGLDMAMGNRHVIVSQGTHDYRNGNGVKKKNDVNVVRGNLLHIRVYPYRGSHRDDLSHWLVYNDESQALSWSPTNVFIDDSLKAPRDLQTVFFAISPAPFDVLHANSPTSNLHSTEPFVYDDTNRIERYRYLGKQQQHHQQQHHRNDYKHTKNGNSPPILVCETGEKALPENRQFNFDDDVESRLITSNGPKTDATVKCTETNHPLHSREFPPPKSLIYDTNKHAEKRNQVSIERRSVHFQGESTVYQAETMPVSPPATGGASIATQFMLRSTRGNRQYDVPQVECPISEDGMERFACPTADRMGRYRCIDDHVLCDGFIDCPEGEDEDRQACMFYKTTKAHLDVLADAILRWARGR